ncbi:MAG TPA: methionine adenosyltransferase [Candidatus Bathyarchaeota archaeon]|nr:MAG: methionine adenosyltransferase [Candidatus Bathyarchaeota archaeon]HDJ26506.1 methionine adenosyltransferase [Candidatus Bathyarchaeota archaeon]
MGGPSRNLFVDELRQTPIEEQPLEIVERKGLGHPDYICDAVMNEVSVNLCAEYLKRFNTILHHNVDKSLLVAGEAEIRFGGGRVLKPMLLVFGDRATMEYEGAEVPVAEIAVETAKEWFRKHMRFVDPEEHVRYQVELKSGSPSLVDIFKREKIGANDTSAAVGYAPMSKTEKVVFDLERFLNSREFKREFEETGEDIKVMGFRLKDKLSLTVSMAFVDRFVPNESYYFRVKDLVLERIHEFVKEHFDFSEVRVDLNVLDRPGRGLGGVYLTVLGTSADSGDSGQVGRGNRVNGVIPLNRPMCSEAAAGKNPVSHVGKIYNVLTHRMADAIYRRVSGLREVYVWLLSQIGRPIDEPLIAAAQVILEPGVKLAEVRGEVEEVMNSELDDIRELVWELARGEIPIC